MNFLLHHSDTQGALTRRQLLILSLAGATTLAIPGPARAQTWKHVAGINDYLDGATLSDTELLQLDLPLVAEDGSAVPLTIKAVSQNTTGPFIQRLTLLAPQNPTPEIAKFKFGQDIGTLNLTTRIRLSQSQTVVAIAHTSDGKVSVTERDVRVTTSGCIAPAQADGSNEMKTRVRLPQSWAPGTPGEVLTMIAHPMITGLATDSEGATPPQRIIQTFQATLNGTPVVSATYYRSLSMNPYLRFDMTPQQEGELQLTWTEDTGHRVKHTEDLRLS